MIDGEKIDEDGFAIPEWCNRDRARSIQAAVERLKLGSEDLWELMNRLQNVHELAECTPDEIQDELAPLRQSPKDFAWLFELSGTTFMIPFVLPRTYHESELAARGVRALRAEDLHMWQCLRSCSGDNLHFHLAVVEHREEQHVRVPREYDGDWRDDEERENPRPFSGALDDSFPLPVSHEEFEDRWDGGANACNDIVLAPRLLSVFDQEGRDVTASSAEAIIEWLENSVLADHSCDNSATVEKWDRDISEVLERSLGAEDVYRVVTSKGLVLVATLKNAQVEEASSSSARVGCKREREEGSAADHSKLGWEVNIVRALQEAQQLQLQALRRRHKEEMRELDARFHQELHGGFNTHPLVVAERKKVKARESSA